MPKATRKSGTGEEAEPVPSGVINTQEAQEHKQNIEDTVKELQKRAKTEEVQEIVKSFIQSVREASIILYTPMTESNVTSVLHSIKDPYKLALRLVTEEIKTRLEAIMPDKELSKGKDIAQMVENVELITPEIKEMI